MGELLLSLVLHLALAGLPMLAAALLCARLGVASVPVLLAVGLATGAALAMLAFWAYYANHELGESLSFFVLFGSVLALGWSLWGGRIESGLLRALLVPFALWMLGAAFLLFLGFMHGGSDQPLAMSSTRFSSPLPTDNGIPLFFTEWFFDHGHHGLPPEFPGEWQASDRPPLQTGYALLQHPFGWDRDGLDYQVLGVVLQQLWIVGLWALLVAAKVGRTTRALAVVAVLLSSVAIVNGFYVWPKLLPAALILAAAALVITPLWTGLRRNLLVAALVAALLGLAMLGHGSSVFGVIPLALIAALRGLPSWRWVAVAGLVGIAVMAPWSAYQKYGDPPGNRLTKWMLAGEVEVDDRGTSEAILDSYREAGLGGAIHNKGQNFVTMAGGGPAVEFAGNAVDALGEGDLEATVRELRFILFFYLLPSFGLLLLAPVAMAVASARGRPRALEWDFSLTCFAVVLIGCFFWGLLLFGNFPSRAAVHVGSLALPILALAAAVAGLRATFPRAAVYLVALAGLLMLAIYTPSFEPPPGSSYSVPTGLIALASLAGFCAVAFLRPAREPEPPAPEPEPAAVPVAV
ncbi:MAG TPA: hypothetical protein VFI03_05210 [Solirubrobacterales bacterium]|nr:hypothetical protein [Solirubrobacterales bacterium]